MNPARTHRSTLTLLAGLVLAALALHAERAEARPHRPGQIPNGSVNGCANCHNSPFGGDARNLFGRMVEADFLTERNFNGNVLWGPELAGLDADGDGATNGQELQDPDGAWRPGDPAPGDPAKVTKPWDPTSKPEPPPVTAVAATTWARVKAAVQDLLD